MREKPGQIIETDPIPGWTSYKFHYHVGINRQFFQYSHRFVNGTVAVYTPYNNVIVTGNENLMWWVQPMFGLIIGLLALAGYLAVR